MCTGAHTADPFKVNKHRYSGITISARMQHAAADATSEQSLDEPDHTFVICMLAADKKTKKTYESLMNLNVFYTHSERGLLAFWSNKNC